jgi:SAM-dependent methyltransferase
MPSGLAKQVLKPSRAPSQAELLHHGGRAAAWANLGLWPLTKSSAPDALPAPDYATACAALADAVAAAAGPLRGQRVLALGCGSGQELLHWVLQHGAREAVGIDTDTGAAAGLSLPPQARLLRGSAMDMAAALQCDAAGSGATTKQQATDQESPAAFDALLCVDAAYHFSPRNAWLQQGRKLLRSGGRIAFTDLVLDAAPAASGQGLRASTRLLLGPALRLAARTAGVHPAELLPLALRTCARGVSTPTCWTASWPLCSASGRCCWARRGGRRGAAWRPPRG